MSGLTLEGLLPWGGDRVPMCAFAYVAVAAAAAGSLRGCPDAVTRRSEPLRAMAGSLPTEEGVAPPASSPLPRPPLPGLKALMVRSTPAGGVVAGTSPERPVLGVAMPLLGETERARSGGAIASPELLRRCAPSRSALPGEAAPEGGRPPEEPRLVERYTPPEAVPAAGGEVAVPDQRTLVTCSTLLSLMYPATPPSSPRAPTEVRRPEVREEARRD